jgi:hypothetical protein
MQIERAIAETLVAQLSSRPQMIATDNNVHSKNRGAKRVRKSQGTQWSSCRSIFWWFTISPSLTLVQSLNSEHRSYWSNIGKKGFHRPPHRPTCIYRPIYIAPSMGCSLCDKVFLSHWEHPNGWMAPLFLRVYHVVMIRYGTLQKPKCYQCYQWCEWLHFKVFNWTLKVLIYLKVLVSYYTSLMHT